MTNIHFEPPVDITIRVSIDGEFHEFEPLEDITPIEVMRISMLFFSASLRGGLRTGEQNSAFIKRYELERHFKPARRYDN